MIEFRTGIPIAFLLTSSKEENVYEKFLREVIAAAGPGPHCEPPIVMSDFEVGLRNALKKVFPNANVRGCVRIFVRSFD